MLPMPYAYDTDRFSGYRSEFKWIICNKKNKLVYVSQTVHVSKSYLKPSRATEMPSLWYRNKKTLFSHWPHAGLATSTEAHVSFCPVGRRLESKLTMYGSFHDSAGLHGAFFIPWSREASVWQCNQDLAIFCGWWRQGQRWRRLTNLFIPCICTQGNDH